VTENREQNRNVVNVSSTAGRILYPNRGQSIYASSKSALETLTRHMASEFAVFGVRVNAIAPNSFPEIVPIAAVVDGVRELDGGSCSGAVMVIDRSQSGELVSYLEGVPVEDGRREQSLGQRRKGGKIA
jgi:NAD(P)-dependent dehydrogenase (short-subunit alcohol dehydrogenase family)